MTPQASRGYSLKNEVLFHVKNLESSKTSSSGNPPKGKEIAVLNFAVAMPCFIDPQSASK